MLPVKNLLLLCSVLSFVACGGSGGGGGGNSGGNSIPPPPPPPTRTAETVVFVAADGLGVNGINQLYAVEDDGSNQRNDGGYQQRHPGFPDIS